MAPLFVKFLVFILRNCFNNQNDVEYDFSISHALELFQFLIFKTKNVRWTMLTPCKPPKFIYIDISIYFGPILSSHDNYHEYP